MKYISLMYFTAIHNIVIMRSYSCINDIVGLKLHMHIQQPRQADSFSLRFINTVTYTNLVYVIYAYIYKTVVYQKQPIILAFIDLTL